VKLRVESLEIQTPDEHIDMISKLMDETNHDMNNAFDQHRLSSNTPEGGETYLSTGVGKEIRMADE
jgi:hypothetical protein